MDSIFCPGGVRGKNIGCNEKETIHLVPRYRSSPRSLCSECIAPLETVKPDREIDPPSEVSGALGKCTAYFFRGKNIGCNETPLKSRSYNVQQVPFRQGARYSQPRQVRSRSHLHGDASPAVPHRERVQRVPEGARPVRQVLRDGRDLDRRAHTGFPFREKYMACNEKEVL